SHRRLRRREPDLVERLFEDLVHLLDGELKHLADCPEAELIYVPKAEDNSLLALQTGYCRAHRCSVLRPAKRFSDNRRRHDRASCASGVLIPTTRYRGRASAVIAGCSHAVVRCGSDLSYEL